MVAGWTTAWEARGGGEEEARGRGGEAADGAAALLWLQREERNGAVALLRVEREARKEGERGHSC